MKLSELFDDILVEAKLVWGKKGKDKVVKKYRCTTGRRTGRIVSKAADCGKPLDLKKRARFRKIKAAKGKMMARRAKRTKKMNPASKRVRQLNKGLRK